MKALKWLEVHNVEFEERAIKEENPTYEELKEWQSRSGLPLKKFNLRRIKRMVHNERTSTQKVLQYQWYDIQTDEPERQIKRNDRRRPVKTPGNRRNARKTPISNRR